MPSANEYLNQPTLFTGVVLGPAGSGKSDLALTFPRVYAVTCDPGGLEFLKNKSPRSQELAKNLAWVEQFEVESKDEGKDHFYYVDPGRLEPEAGNVRSIYRCLNHARSISSEWDTFLFDGLTYFVNMAEQYLLKNAAGDTQGAWGQLKLFLNQLVRADLLTLATRLQKHVIITGHVKRLSEEQIGGSVNRKTGKKGRGRVQQEGDIAPAVDGSFKEEIEGLPGAVIYLEHRPGKKMFKTKEGEEKYVESVTHSALCLKTTGYGAPDGTGLTIVAAKNRYGLPARLELTDKHFYKVFRKFTDRTEAAAQ